MISNIHMKPIGVVRTSVECIPRHWSVSETEGLLVLEEAYQEGLMGMTPGQEVVVLFHFHKSPAFTPDLLQQTPPHSHAVQGVFNICSPRRPNPIGMSVVKIMDIDGHILRVKWLDMVDGTPVLDIKPLVACRTEHRKSPENG